MKRLLSVLLTLVMLFAGGTMYAQQSEQRSLLNNGFAQSISKAFGDKSYDRASVQAGQSEKAYAPQEDEYLKLYGVISQRNSWNDGTAPAAYGMYSFNATANQSELDFTQIFLDDRMITTNNGVYADGKYYLFYVQQYYGIFQGLTMITFDAETGEVLSELPVEGAKKADVPYTLTYDKSTKTVYGYVQETDENYMPVYILAKVSLETGRVEKIGTLKDCFFVFATTDTGVLYGISEKGELKIVDKKTAEATTVGQTGYQPKFLQSGTIDSKEGVLYWAYYSFRSGMLLKVNLADASTTELASFPDGENILGLHTRTEDATASAPAAVENLRVRYESAGSMNAMLSASAPVLTFEGGEMTEDMSVLFFVDDQPAGQKDNVAPGSVAEVFYTFESEGLHRVSAKAVCGDEEGPVVTIETYAGLDTPQGVTNLVLDLDKATGEYTLSWDAPVETGVNNGIIDTKNVKYRIMQYPACTVLEEAYEGTSISGKVEGKDLKNYFFGVIAISGGKESVEVQSNRIAFGDAISVPFNEDFETDMTWGLYTIRDANNDGYTWALADGRAAYQGYNCPSQGNDWLFTPPVNMREGVTYTLYVTFDGGYWQTESFKIIASTGTDLTNPNSEVLYNKTEEFLYGQISVQYTAKKTGKHYFGFQCYSAAGIRGISIDGYNIVAGTSQDSPANVENFVVTPADLGELKATLRFNAPQTNNSGAELGQDEMTSIAIFRDGEFTPIKVFDNPEKGAEYEFVDENAIHGTNTYNAVVYSALGNSEGLKASAWVGEDYANKPVNFEAVINTDNSSVSFSWDKPQGSMHNGYVDESAMTYTLMFAIPELTENFNVIAEGIKDTKYVDTEVLATFLQMPDQYDIVFVVAAVTGAGMGEPASCSGSTGDAYGLPYWESFSGGYLTTAPWTVYAITEHEKDSWLLVEDSNSPYGVMSYDNDGGCAMFYQQEGYSESRLIGPRINLKGTVNPVLRVYMYHDITVGEDNYLQIEVRSEAGDRSLFEAVGEPVKVNNNMYGWICHEFSLQDYIDYGEFRISYHGAADKDVDFYIDNISIREAGEWDGYPAVSDLKAERADVTFAQLDWSVPANENGFEILGYDVYMDGVKVNDAVIPENTYRMELPDKDMHRFTVRTVFEFGYSVESNVAELESVGIENLSGDMMLVYAQDDNIVVKNAAGEMVRIFTVDGRQIFADTVEGDITIPAAKGIYMVSAGDETFKIAVR